jgi:hypothetical protein
MFGGGYENCPEFGNLEVGHKFSKDPSKKLKCTVHVFVILIVCDFFEWIRLCADFSSFVIICIVVGDLDPVIKRGVFGVPLTALAWHIFVHVQDLDFQRHMSWSFLSSVKMRGDF